jgi:endo-1,4-beta-xylanase
MTKNRKLIKRRTFVLGIGAVILASKIKDLNQPSQAANYANRDYAVVGATSLRDRFATKGLLYGAAVSQRSLASDLTFADRFVQECAILVPENDLKWKTLRPTPDQFNFASGDWLANFARSHGILLRGHTLVWHDGMPEWFASVVDSRNAKQMLEKHIATVVGHYAGKMHSWDVVNEAIDPADGRSDGLRQWPWLQFMGPDYIEIAFRAAHEADPQALLVYNDHRLEYDTSEEEARRTAVLKLLERLKSRGTPIHALGMQAHLRGDETRFNAKKLRDFMHNVASLGLKIMITEMDVTDQKLPKDIGTRDRIVAGMYEDYLAVVLDEPAVIAVLTWGLSDRYTWLSSYKSRKDRALVRPLPLNAQLKRKLAWNAIARAVDN